MRCICFYLSTVNIRIEQFWLYYYVNVFVAKIRQKMIFIIYAVKYRRRGCKLQSYFILDRILEHVTKNDMNCLVLLK